MAPKSAMKPLSQETVEQLLLVSANGKFLPTIVLPSGAGDSSSVDTVCVAAVVHARLGGFMIMVPSDPAVRACLTRLELELGLEAPAFHPCSVPLQTSRGAELGFADAEHVDLPWGAAGAFFPSAALRGKFKQAQVTQFTVGVRVVDQFRDECLDCCGVSDCRRRCWRRPRTAGRHRWEPLEEAEVPQPPAPVGESELQRMQKRIEQLESELRHRPRQDPVPPTVPFQARPEAAPMFGIPNRSSLQAEDWARFQTLAGAPLPGVNTAEQRRLGPPADDCARQPGPRWRWRRRLRKLFLEDHWMQWPQGPARAQCRFS